MKKIIFYTDTPILGGAEKHMIFLAKYLDPKKFQVSLVCSNYKQLDPFANEFEKNKIPVFRINVLHKHDPRTLLQLKRIFKQEKPDILHLHLWNPGSCRYAFLAANCKIIATEHDPFKLSGIKKTFKKYTLKKTAHTITVSNANKNLILSLYPELKDKISVIHNGIDLQEFSEKLQNLNKADSKDFMITSIAALHPRKGLKYLIAAFAEVQKEHPNIKLNIVGEGEQKNELQNLIKNLDLVNKVMLLGYQENIAQILKNSDLFVLPSIKEAFGLAILEAWAAELPVIASKVGGIVEIIEDQKNGILVESENATMLTQAIEKLIKDKSLRQKLAAAGKESVKKFDLKTMVKKTENLYDNL